MYRGYAAAQAAYDRQDPPEDKPSLDWGEVADMQYKEWVEEQVCEMRRGDE